MVEPDPAPDFDEEQYQNELNDAVDDGGGCAETWETLSEARDKFTPDRRSVLKGVGALGASAVGVSSLGVATAKEKPGNEEIEVALNSDAVQALLEELHYPDVRKNAAKKIKPKIQNADEDEELDTDELLSILKLPTKIGDIIYPLIDQEEGSPVIFRFKGKGTRPGKYNDLPDNVSSGLISDGEDITIVRGATKHEIDVILNATRFDNKKI